MNCVEHPETTATAFCRECGKALCDVCRQTARGTVYCAAHLPAGFTGAATGAAPPPLPVIAPPPASYVDSPYAASVSIPRGGGSPWLALMLGVIPGLGAIYNRQYAKGFVHALVSGLLISILSSGRAGGMDVLVSILIATWWGYMVFEAYHTAKRRYDGLEVEEFAELLQGGPGERFPMGALILIGLGFVMLLNTTDIVSMEQIEKFWPLGLIGLGVYLLYSRLSPAPIKGMEGRKEEVRR